MLKRERRRVHGAQYEDGSLQGRYETAQPEECRQDATREPLQRSDGIKQPPDEGRQNDAG